MYDFNSTGYIKSFCSNCGSALPNIQMGGALLVVPDGSFDSDIRIKPDRHIFYARMAEWDEGLERVLKLSDFPHENDA